MASRCNSSLRPSSLGSVRGVGIGASWFGSSQEASKLGHKARKRAAPTQGVPDKSRVLFAWYRCGTLIAGAEAERPAPSAGLPRNVNLGVFDDLVGDVAKLAVLVLRRPAENLERRLGRASIGG